MKYIDYRKKLGLSFDNKNSMMLLKRKCINTLSRYSNYGYSEDDYLDFCNIVGCEYDYGYTTGCYEDVIDSLKQCNGKGFVFAFTAFLNTISNEDVKNVFEDVFIKAFYECNINVEIVEDEDGVFVFPNGAKELDEALISQPLEWLKDYPKSHATFVRALKQYSNGEYARDVADNFRKALEEFLQEFLENQKNLETNKNEICRVLSENGADSNIGSMLQALLNSYKNLNDKVAKHNDKVDSKFLEFLMYQTGLFIRMIITTCDNKEEE